MKLYFVIDYNSGDRLEEAEDDFNGTTHRCRDKMYEHEKYENLNYFIKYQVFSGICRNSRQAHEHQLVEVPEELVFQYMLLGLRDLDYVCYNHETKRIMLSDSLYSASHYASSDKSIDEIMAEKNSYRSPSYGYANKKKVTPMFDFNIRDACSEEREEIIFEPSQDVYSDYIEVLMPYIHNQYRQNLITSLNYFKYENYVIGPSSDKIINRNCVRAMDDGNYIKLNVPSEELCFLFSSYFDDDEFWKNSSTYITTNDMEVMRCYAVDIKTRFHECTEWDNKN